MEVERSDTQSAAAPASREFKPRPSRRFRPAPRSLVTSPQGQIIVIVIVIHSDFHQIQFGFIVTFNYQIIINIILCE